MTLPNFVIVGAAKAGTTSLYKYLAQHPQIYVSPIKEPRYFAPEYYTEFYHNAIGNQHRAQGMSLAEYKTLFQGVTDETAIGEASTEYLLFEKSAKRIKTFLPNAKIIIILRDPVERAFSAYSFHVRDGREPLSFEKALSQEMIRKKQRWQVGWCYREGGLYYQQVKRYYQLFPHDQIKLIIWRDLNQNPKEVCSDLFDFLQVNADFEPDLSRSNQSLTPKNKFLNRYLFQNRELKKWLRKPLPEELYLRFTGPLKKMFFVPKESLDPDIKEHLRNSYSEDIAKLEALISVDLSHWKQSSDQSISGQ